MSGTAQRRAFAERHLLIQPSLDESTWRLSGQLVGVDGRVVDKVLTEIADEFPPLPDGTRESRSARTADALVMMCQDSRSSSDPRPLIGGADRVGVCRRLARSSIRW